MFLKTKVKIPKVKGKIVINKQGIVLYETERRYNEEKKYNVPSRVSIGKVCEDGKMMIPTNKYSMYFYDENLSEEIKDAYRSRCIRIGTFLVFREIMEEKKLLEILEGIYEDYAYNHLQFTKEYKIYSDSTSKMLNAYGLNPKTIVEKANYLSIELEKYGF